jgi:hypothetical protein
MVDRTTRWLEAVPLKDIEAVTCTDAFVATWVARFTLRRAVSPHFQPGPAIHILPLGPPL